MTNKGVRRKTFAAREDLIDQLSRFAKEKDLTLYSYVNDLFELAIMAENDGMDLSQLIEERELLDRARKAGFTLVPERLWYSLVKITCDYDEGEAIKYWRKTGIWLARRYASSEVDDPLMALKRDLGQFSWDSPKINITRSGDELVLSASSSKLSENHTALYGTFLEGVLNAFEYKVAERDIVIGNIYLRAIKEG